MELIQISLDNIDLSSEDYDKYLCSYGRDSSSLLDSLKQVGLIYPVILKRNQGVAQNGSAKVFNVSVKLRKGQSVMITGHLNLLNNGVGTTAHGSLGME